MDPKWDRLDKGYIRPISISLRIRPYQLTIPPFPPCHRIFPGWMLDGGMVAVLLGQCNQVYNTVIQYNAVQYLTV